MILKLLLSIQMICKMSTKILRNTKRKILIVFDDMIADLIKNKKSNPVVTVFLTQSYSKVPKDLRLNSTHIFNLKIPNKTELNQMH